MSTTFRYLTPTDVDRFIQVPDTLQVDARNLVLTVDEDTLQKYDHQFLITDYAIYCEIPKLQFFSTSMDWKYKVIQDIDASGHYLGPNVYDAHHPQMNNPLALTADIISTTATKAYLGVTTKSTRFVHYKQCNKFYKYSFKVGDALSIAVKNAAGATQTDASGNAIYRTGQLYGVYLNTSTGVPLPYWKTVAGDGSDQTAEVRQFFYADSVELGSALSVIAASGQLVSSLDGGAQNVTVVAPPDPEFIRTTASGIVGGSLVYRKDASGNLVIRPVGEQDSSGVWVQYTAGNFVKYTTEATRALLLYWVVEPQAAKLHLGEEMYAAWASVNFGASAGYLRPLRDFRDASGYPTSIPTNLLELHKFTVSRDLAAASVKDVALGIQNVTLAGAAPRLYLPASRFVVNHEKPTEPDVPSPTTNFNVPFAYEVGNMTDFDDTKKSIMGGRVMQLVSQYLFDAATNKELGYFPFFLNESKTLNDKIIDALAALIKTPDGATSVSRTDILSQIMVKYGKKYFDEYAVLNQVTNERIGDVWAVLQRIDELFLFFTVTVRTTVSNRTKDDVEVIRLKEVPVVVRIFDA